MIYTIICFQEFLYITNNLQAIIWFQVTYPKIPGPCKRTEKDVKNEGNGDTNRS